jgi:hypothetical protein
MDRMTGVRLLAEQGFSLRQNVQTGPGVYPAPCPMGIGVLSSEVIRSGRETNRSRPSMVEVKNARSKRPTCTPSRLHGMVHS